jgi:hypothetical protein
MNELSEAVFQVEGDIAIPSVHAGGPWNTSLQHGGAPASLIARAAERIPSASPMRVARLTIDLCCPVPIAPLTITTRVVRDGRKIQLSEITLAADRTEVVRASILKIRRAELKLPAYAEIRGRDLPGPDAGHEPSEIAKIANPFLTGISVRVISGGFHLPGPAAIWFRAVRPIVAGEVTTALMRATLAADFSNGTSSLLDIKEWTFINGDLTVSLARDPVGEWILLEAESWLGPHGGGIAHARLCDARGPFGRALQSLIVEKVR